MEEEEIAKLRAETQLLNLQAEKEREELSRLKREANAAFALAQRPSEKYWFIPKAASFWKPVAAGLALAGAFFFLFRPIVEQESTLASLKADIQEQRNIKLELSNQDAEARLIQEKERLIAEHNRNKKEYQAIIDGSKAAAKKAIELARDLDKELARLTEIATDSNRELVERLNREIANNERAAEEAAALAQLFQTRLETRLLDGLRIKVWYYRETENIARLIANPLEAAGAIVSSLKSRAFLQANENRIRGFGVNSESVAQVSAVISNIVELQTLDLGKSVSGADVVIWLNKKK